MRHVSKLFCDPEVDSECHKGVISSGEIPGVLLDKYNPTPLPQIHSA